ncbi:hypothetical protein ENUP19_0364G0035 [Entamoeba nuttalli]
MKGKLLIIEIIFLSICYGSIENCAKEFSEGRCIECESGFTLSVVPSTEGVPKIICVSQTTDSNCETTADGYCTKCYDGYYLKDNSCTKCSENCELCNDLVCYKCNETYFLSTDQKRCTQCTGDDAPECGKCKSGYYFSIEQKACTKCSPFCSLCTESDNCFQCTDKHYLNGTYNCLEIDHCDSNSIKDDHCEKCDKKYRLDGGGCVACTVENCDECFINIDNKEECFKCLTGFIPYNGECVTLKSINCEVGSEIYGCQRCIDGYFLNSDLVCEQCDITCSTCITTSKTCLSCKNGYYFDGDICKKVEDNCSKYDQSGCKECKNDLVHTGLYIPEGEKTCHSCSENCTLCDKEADHCTACVANKMLKPTLSGTFTCEDMDDTCEKAQMGYCIECKQNYFIGLDMQCIHCDESCGSCESSNSCTNCAPYYYRGNNGSFCSPFSEINMTCTPTMTGCAGNCNKGYYAENTSQINCTACPIELNCKNCIWYSELEAPGCKECDDEQHYPNSTKYCIECQTIEHCLSCDKNGCKKCEKGYSPKDNGMCSKNNLNIIIPVVVIIIIIIVIILIIIIVIVSWKSIHKKNTTKSIKPFKVTSDLELSLLTADNKNFPLKTQTWELSFGLDKNKALVDKEYEQNIQIANTTKKAYFFEVLATPSHRYDLKVEPPRYTLKSGEAMELKFKIKMLCTASVSDEIGIIAMDVDDQNKETAKINLIIESDLSLKLDHTDLTPQMPPIGEGAFGMVFRGTYRGREVAIKKMKSRNMTQEQEKEFSHEVSMLTQLRHKCVVEFIGAVYTEGEIAIVTEFAEYGSLSKIWGKHELSFELKIKILDDLAIALQFLHQNQIIHRDVKGENVLIYSLNPHSDVCGKLTDFGTCRNISERNRLNKELTQGIGTPTYMAPECLQNFDYSYPIDVYAYGIVLYETYIEKGGYSDENVFDQPWKIPQFVIEGKRLPKPDGIPENYWQLTQDCWSQNPEDRPTFIDVLKEIEKWGLDIKYALVIDCDEKPSSNQLIQKTAAVQDSSSSSPSDN